MRKKWFPGNMLKDMWKRDYAVFLLFLVFALFVDTFYFAVRLLDAARQAGGVLRMIPLSGMWSSTVFALIAPFAIVARQLYPLKNETGSNVFYSLPVSRNAMFCSTLTMALAYLALFLASDTILQGLLCAFSKHVKMEKGYFFGRVVFTAAIYCFCLGLAFIAFSQSSSILWYMIVSAALLITVLLLAKEAVFIVNQRIIDDVAAQGDSDVLVGLMRNLPEVCLISVLYILNTSLDGESRFFQDRSFCAQILTRSSITFLVAAVLLLVIACLLFRYRRPEYYVRKNIGRGMLVLFQGVTVALPMLNCWADWELLPAAFMLDINKECNPVEIGFWIPRVSVSDFTNGKLNGVEMVIIIALSLCAVLISQLLYERSLRKLHRCLPGLLCGFCLIAVAFVLV